MDERNRRGMGGARKGRKNERKRGVNERMREKQ